MSNKNKYQGLEKKTKNIIKCLLSPCWETKIIQSRAMHVFISVLRKKEK